MTMLPDPREALIHHYFAMCNAADREGLIACFAPDAVHYFPPGLADTPWRGGERIAEGWIWCVEHLGSQWTVESVLLPSADRHEAVIEWTHWKRNAGTAQRGDEWYRFDPTSGLISEIRAYYAAPAATAPDQAALVGFDYVGRGYHMAPAGRT